MKKCFVFKNILIAFIIKLSIVGKTPDDSQQPAGENLIAPASAILKEPIGKKYRW